MSAASQTVVLTVDESVTYQVRIAVDTLIEPAAAAGHTPDAAGVQEWIAAGGIDSDDQLITDGLEFLAVNDRIVDPETTIEQQEV